MNLRAQCALVLLSAALAACGESDNTVTPDAMGTSGCDPTTALPANYRPIAKVSLGAVTVTTTGDVTSGTIDARAGGSEAADNPYIYVDLRSNMRVDVNDVQALTSTNWDIALKRSSLRTNSGDSGAGNRQVAIVQAATLAEVTAGPSTGYATDDYATADCTFNGLPFGEPNTTFGEWYDYNDDSHKLTPKPEVYVIERNNGTRTAFRLISYYGDAAQTLSSLYQVEWKQLPSK
jgi:hypothetical protein